MPVRGPTPNSKRLLESRGREFHLLKAMLKVQANTPTRGLQVELELELGLAPASAMALVTRTTR